MVKGMGEWVPRRGGRGRFTSLVRGAQSYRRCRECVKRSSLGDCVGAAVSEVRIPIRAHRGADAPSPEPPYCVSNPSFSASFT